MPTDINADCIFNLPVCYPSADKCESTQATDKTNKMSLSLYTRKGSDNAEIHCWWSSKKSNTQEKENAWDGCGLSGPSSTSHLECCHLSFFLSTIGLVNFWSSIMQYIHRHSIIDLLIEIYTRLSFFFLEALSKERYRCIEWSLYCMSVPALFWKYSTRALRFRRPTVPHTASQPIGGVPNVATFFQFSIFFFFLKERLNLTQK